MAGESVGLDLASQSGQEDIVEALGNLDLSNSDIVTAIGNLITALANVTGIQGPAGADGRGIASISKTGTSGNVDTYTITFTDNQNPVTFTVTNTDMTYPVNDGTYILQISSGVASWVTVSNGDGGAY